MCGCRSRAVSSISRMNRRVSMADASAGDCFVAGFLTGALRGWEWPTILRFANAAGAHSVGSVGAVTGLRGTEEILAWMEER